MKLSASILLIAGLALTGCSSAAPSTDAPTKTEQQASPTAGPLTQENFAERISKAQLKAGSAHVSMAMPDGTGTTEGSIQISEDPSKISGQMTMTLPTGSAEVRIVDGNMYMNMGELSQNKFIDLSQTPMKDQVNASISQMNPEAQLQSFTNAIETFKAEPGTEQIDGVDVAKVTLVLNTQKLLESNVTLKEQAGAVADSLGETMEYVMYIGADDLPRRITTPSVAGGVGLNMDYSAWGEKVSIAAPSADELIDPSVLGM